MRLIPQTHRIPLSVKIIFTTFMAVLIPTYWYCYGPTNFVYFCDVALFTVLLGIWRESRLLISMAGVGIIAAQLIWVVDFLVELCGGHLTGMTSYMFNENKSLFLRGLSSFHGWLPFLLLYLIARVGYDRRALFYWTALAWSLVLLCYAFSPAPRLDAASIATPVNINYVYGMSDTEPQKWMSQTAWVATLMAGLAICLFIPTHVALRYFFGNFGNNTFTTKTSAVTSAQSTTTTA
jgi:hypothetical protein